MTTPPMPSGYAFLFTLPSDRLFPRLYKDSENWEIEVYTPKGDEFDVGEIVLDGARCVMFQCPTDGKVRAVNKVNVKSTLD